MSHCIYTTVGRLDQDNGSRVPAAHPHPEIPKVPPAGDKTRRALENTREM